MKNGSLQKKDLWSKKFGKCCKLYSTASFMKSSDALKGRQFHSLELSFSQTSLFTRTLLFFFFSLLRLWNILGNLGLDPCKEKVPS